jgi:hypothetical protein
MFRRALPFLLFVCACTSQQDKDRIAQLEKQTKELQEQIKAQERTVDLDLQSKCSNDARIWFNGHWSRDKDTLLLDYQNHYNKSLNKCLVLVQYNWSGGRKGEFAYKTISVHDVYENSERAAGNVSMELGNSEYKPEPGCRLDGVDKKIKEFQECFNLLWSSFMEK